MRAVDGAIPDCEIEGRACVIPPLCEEGTRIMGIHSKLRALNGLVESSAILGLYGATREDIEILAVIEQEFRKNSKESKG